MNLLGQNSDVPARYAPEILFPIPRVEARQRLGLSEPMPFHGEDLWHGWELSWLNESGQPQSGVGRFLFPADTENLVESKSFKLYLNSLNNERYANVTALLKVLTTDLSAVAGGGVSVEVLSPDDESLMPSALPGVCIDAEKRSVSADTPSPDLLEVERAQGETMGVYSHSLRSLCPVTAQPDWATVLVSSVGARVSPGSLLAYLHAFREHQEYHEQCVERMFRDLQAAGLESFSVQALYTRRGGMDINPWRSTSAGQSPRLRSLRQ